jgi:hypothetical protein
MAITATATTKDITYAITLSDTDGEVVDGSFKVAVDSTNSSLAINANKEIELVWGSF